MARLYFFITLLLSITVSSIGQTIQQLSIGDFNKVQWESIAVDSSIHYTFSNRRSSETMVYMFVEFEPDSSLYFCTCDNDQCTEWSLVAIDEDINQGNVGRKLIIPHPSHQSIRFKSEKISHINIAVRFLFDDTTHNIIPDADTRANCTCPMQSYKNRAQWQCPDTEESSIYIPEFTPHTHFVIHHQAGSTFLPYDNTVRAIYDYHVNGNGWSDIGYNWLIAPDGTIYKGRSWLNGDQNVRGAHTCSCNSNKIGICLLGDLTLQLPTNAQYESLKKFIVGKACELNILPDQSSTMVSSKSGVCIEEFVHHITGHKDNCGPGYTACPGNKFYTALESMKSEIISEFYACSDTLNTAISPIVKTEKIKIFPNPSNGNIQLFVSSPTLLTIFHQLGTVSKNYTLLPGHHSLAIDLPDGLYWCKIIDSKSQTIHSLQIIH